MLWGHGDRAVLGKGASKTQHCLSTRKKKHVSRVERRWVLPVNAFAGRKLGSLQERLKKAGQKRSFSASDRTGSGCANRAPQTGGP